MYSTTTAEFSVSSSVTVVAVALTLTSADAATGTTPAALAALSFASSSALGLFGAPRACLRKHDRDRKHESGVVLKVFLKHGDLPRQAQDRHEDDNNKRPFALSDSDSPEALHVPMCIVKHMHHSLARQRRAGGLIHRKMDRAGSCVAARIWVTPKA
jgi:hypothetical protein|eukprot:COSAG06_NODE_83_length_25105_cov_69.740913_27_plen_157_part_00